jgi:hypothetical protein
LVIRCGRIQLLAMLSMYESGCKGLPTNTADRNGNHVFFSYIREGFSYYCTFWNSESSPWSSNRIESNRINPFLSFAIGMQSFFHSDR